MLPPGAIFELLRPRLCPEPLGELTALPQTGLQESRFAAGEGRERRVGEERGRECSPLFTI